MTFSRRCFVFLAIALLSGSGKLSAQVELSRHPYPQAATQDSIALLWRTVGATTPIVRYGPAPELLVNEVLPVQILVRLGPDVQGPPDAPRLHSAPPMTYQYEASIFDLEAGEKYFYGVYDGDTLLAGGDLDHFFTTLPPGDSTESLRLWVVGDSGNGSAAQIAGFDAMRDFVAADGKEIDAYLHLGDMAYNVGTDTEFTANFFDIYRSLLRNTVCWPTMGNHEGFTSSGVTQIGPYYDSYALPTQGESGGLASGTEAYYSFDIGRVHFVCLDSHDLNRSPTGDMALWLKADLEMADADWLIAFWHHPPYTKGSHDSDREAQLIQMRELIMPILESHGVDLVLGGHSHVYERSMLIDGAYDTPTVVDGVVLDDGDGDPAGHGAYRKSASLNPNNGTVALVAGHGRSATIRFGVSPIMRSTVAEVGSVVIDIEGNTLTGKMINSAGLVRDEFQIVKEGDVESEILEYPWRPGGPGYRVGRVQPGETSVEILPIPPAPDAVIYYTTDGSQPTTDSPIYSNAVVIEEGEVVRSMSVWRSGTRQSEVTQAPALPDFISLQTYVASGDDDGLEDAGGVVVLDGDSIQLGGGTAGFRFEEVRIPDDAYVVRAQMHFYKLASDFSSSEGTIWGDLSPDSLPLTDDMGSFAARQTTTQTVPWRAQLWSTSQARDLQSESADLSPIVRELLAQPAWQSGNAMSFFLNQSGTRLAGTYESGIEKATALFVTFISPDGLVERISSQPLTLEIQDEGGEIDLSFESPISEAISALGLVYEIQGSADLSEWETIEAESTSFSFFGLDGFAKMTLRIPSGVADGKPRYYLRLKVGLMEPDP